MVIRESDRRLAVGAYRVAVGMIAQRDPTVAVLASAALEHPTPITVRALLTAGAGKAWLPMLLEALAQVGVAGAEDVLGEQE
ncbi:hypothetical protein [Devosia faecipullorum]|uniref:hypothetical protein n=1 Tax=Devosia faecipullorum TaxID=2755039 RepID=UPI00187B8A11|nr:hypothetical protein [Devosia faecipullorum]MBE7732198.1 hypothetical protein [Devosia faecipullorum]